MSETLLIPLPIGSEGDALVAYLNEHIEEVRQSCDLDVSWAYIRAVVDEVRIVGATRDGDKLRINYEYDYSAFCACKDLDARDTATGKLTCEIRQGNIVLTKFIAPVRSTLDEF